MKNKKLGLIPMTLMIAIILIFGSVTFSVTADEPVIFETATQTDVIGGSSQIVPPVDEFMSDVVAFDMSKGQWTSEVPDFIADLQAAGYTVGTIDIEVEIPDNVEKLIIFGIRENTHILSLYTEAEGTMLADWVDAGGELMITSDWGVGAYADDTAELCEAFSVIPQGTTSVTDPTDHDGVSSWVIYQSDNFATHPIFYDVDAVEFLAGCSFDASSGVIITTDADADPSEVPVAVAMEWGSGRVAIFGDSNWIAEYGSTDGYTKEDNAIMAMNTIYWLNEIPGLEVVKEITYGPIFVPIFTEEKWDLEITVTNNGYVDLDDIWVYDGIGAKLDLVTQDDGAGYYIFKIDGSEIPLGGDDDEYYGDYGDILIWRQANGKDAPAKKPCATNVMWNIDDLEIGESTTLKFRVVTIEFTRGKDDKHTKQAFTSPCHHELNDGPIAVDYFDGDYYTYWGDPVIVSVYYTYDQDPEADSDYDGLYDWEEVTGEYVYITDPCNWDTDGDGYSDGEEIAAGNNPTDPEDHPIPPVAEFTFVPTDPEEDETIDFDGSASSDADGTIVSWEWDFESDDTYDATGETTTHSYATAGIYDVTLRVTDDDGYTHTVTYPVTVTAIVPP